MLMISHKASQVMNKSILIAKLLIRTIIECMDFQLWNQSMRSSMKSLHLKMKTKTKRKMALIMCKKMLKAHLITSSRKSKSSPAQKMTNPKSLKTLTKLNMKEARMLTLETSRKRSQMKRCKKRFLTRSLDHSTPVNTQK